MSRVGTGLLALCLLGCVDGELEKGASTRSSAIYEISQDVVSTATCFNGAACCPAGYAVRGVNLGTSPIKLDCRLTNEPFQDCFIDHSTFDPATGIQMCPAGTYLRGVNPGAQNFVCCYNHHRGYTAFLNDLVTDPVGAGTLTANGGTNFRMCDNAVSGTRYLVGLDGDGSNRLICRSPDAGAAPPPAAMAPNATLPGEVQGSSSSRSYLTYFPSGSSVANHQLWKKINRNWLARVFNIPIPVWTSLHSDPISDPVVVPVIDSSDYVCHSPLKPLNGLSACTGGQNAPYNCPSSSDCYVPREKIHYTSPVDGRSIYAYLFYPPVNPVTPPSSLQRPVVLVTHGHKTNPSIGKDATGNDPASAYHAAARELAAVAQAITIAPDARTWNESGLQSDCPMPQSTPGSSGCHGTYANLKRYGVMPPSYALENIYNLSLALRETFVRPPAPQFPGYPVYSADRSRVYVGGLSLGGWQATWAGALDPRIVSGVIAAGSFLKYWQTNETCDGYAPGFCPNPNPASDRCQVVPGLSNSSGGAYGSASSIIFDSPDFAALAAPAHYLITWGKSDDNFNQSYQTAATNEAQSVYNNLHLVDASGTSSLWYREFTGGHEWDIVTGSPNSFVATACTRTCPSALCGNYDLCGNLNSDGTYRADQGICPSTCAANYSCVSATNTCACAVSNSCGACGNVCPAGTTCSGGTCVCSPIPQGTACAGMNCGTVPNGCGGVYTCGMCGSGQTCGKCEANVCYSSRGLCP